MKQLTSFLIAIVLGFSLFLLCACTDGSYGGTEGGRTEEEPKDTEDGSPEKVTVEYFFSEVYLSDDLYTPLEADENNEYNLLAGVEYVLCSKMGWSNGPANVVWCGKITGKTPDNVSIDAQEFGKYKIACSEATAGCVFNFTFRGFEILNDLPELITKVSDGVYSTCLTANFS